MTRTEQIQFLIDRLLEDMPQYKTQAKQFPADADSQRHLLRSLMNVRPPLPLDTEFLAVQDALLSAETTEKGIVCPADLPQIGDLNISLWQGDITQLAADAIVNAANSAMLGCFIPCHGCIDNAIHSAAGLQLRDECHRIMTAQGHVEQTGHSKLTAAYNLPAKHVLHTVGPIVQGVVTAENRLALKSCYDSCLCLAAERHLQSVAFCCISTGEFHFPNQEAAEIAVAAVKEFLLHYHGIKVIFNVFKDTDLKIYQRLLGAD